jgi:hypothetical protein
MQNNVNPKIISEHLGHANTGITLDQHSRVSEEIQINAAEGLDTLIASADGENDLPLDAAV